jgi:hypothetical protein
MQTNKENVLSQIPAQLQRSSALVMRYQTLRQTSTSLQLKILQFSEHDIFCEVE